MAGHPRAVKRDSGLNRFVAVYSWQLCLTSLCHWVLAVTGAGADPGPVPTGPVTGRLSWGSQEALAVLMFLVLWLFLHPLGNKLSWWSSLSQGKNSQKHPLLFSKDLFPTRPRWGSCVSSVVSPSDRRCGRRLVCVCELRNSGPGLPESRCPCWPFSLTASRTHGERGPPALSHPYQNSPESARTKPR